MTAALPLVMQPAHRVHARLSPAAVASNLVTLRRHLSAHRRTPRIWATVKGDAYGHGVSNVLSGLTGADGLAVMQLDDAYACRAAGWTKALLVFAGLSDAADVAMLDMPQLHLVISHAGQIDWLQACPVGAHPPFIWLRLRGDIGLTGFDDMAYGHAYARCAQLLARGQIAGLGHLHHYASAEHADGIAQANARFRRCIGVLPGPVSTSNSATILRHPHAAAQDDWVRPGLALYGASPLGELSAAALELTPAMSLHSRIVAVRDLAAGERMGYNGSLVATAPTRVGMISCGYADGYPRHAPAGTPVQVGHALTHLLGAVTMDLMTVDLSHLPDVQAGFPVTLWGSDRLPVERVARAIGTIAADLFTGLTRRVPMIVDENP